MRWMNNCVPRVAWLVSSLALTLGCAVVPTASAQGISCRAAAARSTEIRNYLVFVGTSSDSSALHARQELGLPNAAANKIALVTKANTCSTAGQSLNTQLNTPGSPRQLWVFTYGTGHYVVVDPAEPHFDGTLLFFYTSQWTAKDNLGFYNYP